MKKNKWWIVAIAVVAVACLAYGVSSVWRSISDTRAAFEAAAEETAVVRRGTLRVTVDASGSVVPETDVGLVFASGGVVAEVLVEEGERVEAGDPLVRLDTDDLELQVVQAEATLRQSEIRLEALLESIGEVDLARARDAVQQAATSLELARIGYDSAMDSVAVNEQLEDAQSAYDQAVEDLEFWQRKYDEEGVDYWYVDRALEALDDAELALKRAQQQADQQLQSAKSDLDRASDAYRQAQEDLDELLDGPDARDVESAQLDVERNAASLEQARLRLERATLVAPVAGTVTGLSVQAGEMAGAGQAVVVLSDLDTLAVEVNLDETDVALVEVGQEALVTLDAFPDSEVDGAVSYVALVAYTQSGVVLYPVSVQLEAAGVPVRAGMTADVEIVTASVGDVLIVPLRAVQGTEGDYHVLRQVEEGARRSVAGFEMVPVTLGARTETEVVIAAGLSEGDVVSVVAVPAPTGGQGGFGPMRFVGGGGR